MYHDRLFLAPPGFVVTEDSHLAPAAWYASRTHPVDRSSTPLPAAATGRPSLPDRVLITVDLLGTFVFAVEGALSAFVNGLDFLGLMVLSFATALGGGIIRDLLIGDLPPGAIRDWRYSTVAFIGGGAVFFFSHLFQETPTTAMMLLDAAGLSLFAIAGAKKALDFGIHPFLAILMGAITGVGGGTVRDVLLAKIPTVLRADVYATAALAGAAVMVMGFKLRLPHKWMMAAGGSVCFALRVVSVWRHWNLPTMH